MLKQPKLNIAQHSIAGRKQVNEDSFGILIPQDDVQTGLIESKGIAMAIADGMSSCEAPKQASESCIKSFLSDYYATHASWSVKTSVARVLTATNRWLYSQGHNVYQSARGMVSTFSGLVLKSHSAHIFHIGDSRIYLLRNGQIEQLTNDHKTFISKDKEYLSKAMGIMANAEVDYKKLLVEKNDIFIFTTDGVHEFISNKDIANLIEKHSDNLDEAAREIVNFAYDNKSPDNLTCQIVQIENLGVMKENEYLDKLSALPFPPHLEIGMKFEGYEILRELHSSNRVQVYLVKDIKTNEKFVLKTPSINFEDDPNYLEMFTREEWIGNLINNVHVVKIIKSKFPKKYLYYVSEYVDGQTLREWMNDNPSPSLFEVRNIIKQVILGLRALHRKEIIHQDIKPENIVINKDGIVKIIDFGSAHVASLQEISKTEKEPELLGTKNYTAPELLMGHRVNNQADIYSVGIIVYEMLTGKLPYLGSFKNINSIERLNYISAKEYNEDIPFWVDDAIKKAVNIDVAKRYLVMSEFLSDLNKPNPNFKLKKTDPLLKRKPIIFWKGLCALLSVIIILLLMFY